MNLLIITNNPTNASFRQRIQIHLDTLREYNINYRVAKLPIGTLARTRLFRSASQFDCVLLHRKSLSPIDAILLRRYARKTIFDFDDEIMYSDRNPNKPSQKRQKAFERTVRIADMIIAGNSYLAEHARSFNPNVKILPTGLNIKAYEIKPPPKKDNKIRLVWIGSHSTIKYLAEIKPTLERIGSIFDNVVLRIICDEFFDLKNLEVERCLWSEKTEVRNLVASDIGLASLPDNSFTRGKCGFKILQYAAAGLPVVASPVGVNAEYVSHGVTGFHAKSIEQWINRLNNLIEDPLLRKTMGERGSVWVKKFDSNVIGQKLTGLIKECLYDVMS